MKNLIKLSSIITDDETGGYVSYQCVLPLHVHGTGYAQMQMISNSKAEKMVNKKKEILFILDELFELFIGFVVCLSRCYLTYRYRN